MQKLNGCSKFDLKFDCGTEGWQVEKTASSENSSRLIKQARKQADYKSYIDSHNTLQNLFEVPSITQIKEHSFLMPFYSGYSILELIEQDNVYVLNSIIQKLVCLVYEEFDNSEIKEVSASLFYDKINSIILEVNDNRAKECGKKIIQSIDFCYINLPLNRCHGDLTFANMIFSDKIVLLDFLDCYIESPFQDISKIMQELHLQWSYLTNSNLNCDTIKIDIAYKKLLNLFYHHFAIFFDKNNKHITELFYRITLFRILPYIKDKNIYNLILDKIEDSYENTNFTSCR